MMFRSYLSVLFLLTFGNLWVFAGQYGYSETISYANSDFYDSHDIAASKINCIAQCSAKFIWFGTDNGLIRYDGYEFKTYRSDLKSPSIFKNNRISSIAEGPNGRLWIGTRIGLYSMEIRRGSIVPAGMNISTVAKSTMLMQPKTAESGWPRTNRSVATSRRTAF